MHREHSVVGQFHANVRPCCSQKYIFNQLLMCRANHSLLNVTKMT